MTIPTYLERAGYANNADERINFKLDFKKDPALKNTVWAASFSITDGYTIT